MTFRKAGNTIIPMSSEEMIFDHNTSLDIAFNNFFGGLAYTLNPPSSYGGTDYFYNFNVFQVRSQWHYLLQKKATTYDLNGLNPVTMTTNYYYDNPAHLQITSQTTKSSDSKLIETKYFYPQDTEMSNKPFVNDLIVKNIVGIPLDIQSFKDGNKLAEKLTVYENSTATNNLLLPKSVYANKGAATIDINVDKKINYDLYDDKGNILQYTPENGIPISIIWGYNKTQPIAKIENATYDQIASYVNNLQSLSNSDNDNCTTSNCKEQFLRNSLNALRASLPQCMVSSYTYDPLVGVTSITDAKGISAYYEYDSFGRLKFVKDQDLNVINSYCYNYKGQTIDCSSASSVVYYNAEKSGFFTKNNCGTNTTPSEGMLYKIEAGKYTSITSQADADAQALTDLNTNGQNYINSHSSCLTIYKNEFVSGFFTKNNCDIGGIAGQQIFGIGRGEYTSTISQADADAKAQAGLAIRGQAYANEHGYCMYTNNEAWGVFQKNDCEYPYWWGEYVWYYVPAGTYFGSSQEDADRTAQISIDAYGQEYANAHGSCY
jgi:YD repeat-containing protein